MAERKRVLSVTLADCEVQHFRSGGKGGQNQNKRDTGARVIHHPSGARGESREERSQLQNKRTAFLRMIETAPFKAWMRVQLGQDALMIAEVDRELWPDRIKIETYDSATGAWVETKKEGI